MCFEFVDNVIFLNIMNDVIKLKFDEFTIFKLGRLKTENAFSVSCYLKLESTSNLDYDYSLILLFD